MKGPRGGGSSPSGGSKLVCRRSTSSAHRATSEVAPEALQEDAGKGGSAAHIDLLDSIRDLLLLQLHPDLLAVRAPSSVVPVASAAAMRVNSSRQSPLPIPARSQLSPYSLPSPRTQSYGDNQNPPLPLFRRHWTEGDCSAPSPEENNLWILVLSKATLCCMRVCGTLGVRADEKDEKGTRVERHNLSRRWQ